jgi:hypothetical protein
MLVRKGQELCEEKRTFQGRCSTGAGSGPETLAKDKHFTLIEPFISSEKSFKTLVSGQLFVQNFHQNFKEI